VGRAARIYKDGEVVGYAQSITGSATAEAVKDYSMDSEKPAFLESGHQSFKWSAKMLYVDNEFLSALLAGDKFDLAFVSTVEPYSAPYETWTDCVVLSWDKTAGMAGGILQSVSGEAASITPSA
jgi:hypothetical protein